MKLLFFVLTLMVFTACDRNDQAGSVGSGAGLHEEKSQNERQDADGGDDMNITTPIEERSDLEE